MIALKDYQIRVLDSLREFFRIAARTRNPAEAFQEVLQLSGRPVMPYIPVQAAGLPSHMPYVCLRVPTGGGKTLLACHAVGSAMQDFLRIERAVALWLVPSNTILDQTAEALRDPRHPYRRALELACGPVEVVTIDEALRLSRAAVDGQTVVIVSTIQSFRTDDPSSRKVYDQNGTFSEHLLNLPADRLGDMLEGPDGKPKPSLVNMLRLRRPIVIVDEAHNARTELSFNTLGNILPACVVEFTATPARIKNPSNVLHHVSAAELKAADMVKLPLRVITRHPSQKDQLLAEAITLRRDLELLASAEAQATGEYLRPILLIQADRVDACEPLRERLVAEYGLAAEEIKISVGKLDELPGAEEIRSLKCPVRHIITVQKLREGWDCPFAYVLCSLKETRSATAIEQIVGRILRLPGATAKQHPDLNCAYAFSVSDSLPEVLNELKSALESNGFSTAEAERIIVPMVNGVLPLGVQPKTVRLDTAVIDAEVVAVQARALEGKARIDPERGEITVVVPLSDDEADLLAGCVTTPEAKERVLAAVQTVRDLEKAFGGSGQPRAPSPYERQLDFLVPLLCVAEGDDLFPFEDTFLLEYPWKLSEKDASLPVNYNPLERPKGRTGKLDVNTKGSIETEAHDEKQEDFVVTLHQQALAFNGGTDWTLDALIGWLDRRIDHRDIPMGESAEFLRKALRGLMTRHGITDISMLALDRFRLQDVIDEAIQRHRIQERTAAFREFLLPTSALTVREDMAINFKTIMYEPSWHYEGGYQFKKHYYGPKPGELEEKRADGSLTEEFQCAAFLDELPEVEFWVRNLARKNTSFRLHLSKDWFYPDFVCQLKDGRILVVEYKGGFLWTDAEEKRAIGAVWASRSGGKCLFVMPKERDFTSIIAAIR
ncbi:MAG TPA: DEAD/DEAH box helicase family protein [Kiritimatiellia bacterium]|nr:DEAD/DEAH box helicase family protein [Kiritimatiellia bacterium]HMP35353.1 DEAD/DEAH box helicase family protein [Kiritimatiellia bacterium]